MFFYVLTVVFATFFRGLVNDTYKMDLILIYPPYMIALACIYIASVLKEKDTTAWFEELRVDMNVVRPPCNSSSFPLYIYTGLVFNIYWFCYLVFWLPFRSPCMMFLAF